MEAERVNKLRDVLVLSFTVEDKQVYQKMVTGDWEENNSPKCAFLQNYNPPVGATVTIEGKGFEWINVLGDGVLQPRLVFESAGTEGPVGSDAAKFFREMWQAAAKESHRKRRHSESSEEANTPSTSLPEDLHDIALSSKVREKITGKRIKDFGLEELLDSVDLVRESGEKDGLHRQIVF